ncbi:nucleolin-like [Amphiura filiformis]|uniref:nucleolin-like n=1 Tax=Amphiura filiformis TaxID=82378 RepID=UPI003B214B80
MTCLSNHLLLVFADKITSAQDRADRYKEADVRTIFVKGLNFSTTEDALKKTFGEKVKEIRLPRDGMGRSRGRAFIEFESEEDAEAAIKANQGVEVEGFELFLDYVGEKRKMFSTNVFITGLSKQTTAETLKEKLGAVAVKLRYDFNTQQPTGKATGMFSTREDAQKAIDEYSGKEFEGSEIKIEFTKGKEELEESKYGIEVIVRNLHEDSTEEEGLKEKFEGCTNVKMIKDKDTDKPKGFAFIRYESKDDATKAIEEHHETEYCSNTVTVEMSKPKKPQFKEYSILSNGSAPGHLSSARLNLMWNQNDFQFAK